MTAAKLFADARLAVPPQAAARVNARLDAVRREHGVAIPLAVESGSRAWGFPSPDSDYDCRFVFVRPADDYLSPWERRDVIETPLDGDLDVNGWDLGKAIRLLAKSNAVIVEWLRSPVAYASDQPFRDAFLTLARRVVDQDPLARHYLHLGERHWLAFSSQGEAARLKTAFYALRPAAVLRWLRLHPGDAVAPMDLPTLLAECEPPAGVCESIAELVARKLASGETEARPHGSDPLPSLVAAFIAREFELGREAFSGRAPKPDDAENRRDAETFFRATVVRLHDGHRVITPQASAED
jgi:uncharacterized protein